MVLLDIIKWSGNFDIKQPEITWIAIVLSHTPGHHRKQNLTLNKKKIIPCALEEIGNISTDLFKWMLFWTIITY